MPKGNPNPKNQFAVGDGRPRGGGRPQRTSNERLRALANKLVEDNWGKVLSELDELKGKDYLNFIKDILPYTMTKFASTPSNSPDENPDVGMTEAQHRLADALMKIVGNNQTAAA